MYLHALTTTVPPISFTQAECWEVAKHSEVRHRLSRRSMLTLRAVLRGDSGIATRHFAVTEMDRIFDLGADELNERFRTEAPRLAGRALRDALGLTGDRADEIDALVICTCTGYLCPGVTSYVAEELGLRPDAHLQDLVGLGCGAAIPALRAVEGILAARPDALVACIAVEICSAAFYLDDDPGVLVSACLFADGAAASMWRSQPPTDRRPLRCHEFDTWHVPADRDRLRFEQREGKLRNLLHPSVPDLAAAAVKTLFDRAHAQLGQRPVSRIIAHAGGRDVINALERALPGFDLGPTRSILRRYGNMSSPSVLFALAEVLRETSPPPDGDWWLTSFGAGFSAHACRISGSEAFSQAEQSQG